MTCLRLAIAHTGENQKILKAFAGTEEEMTTMRLAWSSSNSPKRIIRALGKEEDDDVTDMRMVCGWRNPLQNLRAFGSEAVRERLKNATMAPLSELMALLDDLEEEGEDVTQLRLAVCGPPKAIEKGLDRPPAPALLVSYVYMSGFFRMRDRLHFRDWVLDSGAFSAHSKGEVIDLQAYIDKCRELLETDPSLSEVYALDVIGDWRGTVRNTEEMWRQGIPAIPAFHIGSPLDVLQALAKDYPKIALGGVARIRDKQRIAWAQQCFANVWPKRIHGFGFASEKAMMTLPFHSVDATSWEMGPAAFGNWKSFPGASGVRGGDMNLRAEVEWYLELERKITHRWRNELAKLEDEG